MIVRTWLQLFFSLLTLLAGLPADGQSVRVTTWDMAATSPNGKGANMSVEKAADQLRKISPDVVLLRGVTGWKMCSQLAEALQPEDYRIAVCTAFPAGAESNNAPSQIGILTRNAPYLWWSEPWKTQAQVSHIGGFTFAAVHVGGHRFGFCIADLPPGPPSMKETSVRQWLDSLGSFRRWTTNRLEGFVAGTFGPLPNDGEIGRALRAAGFMDVVLAARQRSAGQSIESHLVPNADAPGGLILSRWPLTCDFDFRPEPVIVIAANPEPSLQPANSTVRPAQQATLVWWVSAALAFILLVIVTMLLGIRRKLSRLQAQSALIAQGSLPNPAAALSYNVVTDSPALPVSRAEVPPLAKTIPNALNRSADQETAVRQGIFAHLTQWLKHAFVQRLLSDRKTLLETQQAATMKVLAVDERLARLELKIQEETSSYEKQIEQLNRELLTAREENLELIRGQIKLLKAEMEDARKRVLESEAV